MCGICGKYLFDQDATVSPELVSSMLGTLTHRGPDDEGTYYSGQIGLGHRRLSIIGLCTGHQPLCNEHGTVWITFNGEIYNYLELRQDLLAKGHHFRTDSDTEVIIHLYEEFGEECLTYLRGMFAFALWDQNRRSLFMARDRVGIKPLYYHVGTSGVTFASELKALLVDPDVSTTLNPDMIDTFLTFMYLPGQETLYRNILKLPSGSYMIVRNGKVSIHEYWDLKFENSYMSLQEAEHRLFDLLDESVRLHMTSDVPVGVLLSGGVDSTAILSLAARHANEALNTFTIGFDDASVADERPYARLAAKRFGALHHEMSISPSDFQEFLPKFVRHMEELVCEPPAVALYYVSKLASRHVKVLLSGEGGDEAFAGYPNYRNGLWLERIKKYCQKVHLDPLLATLSMMHKTGRGRSAKYLHLATTPFDDHYFSRTADPLRHSSIQSKELYSSTMAGSLNRLSSTRVFDGWHKTAPQSDVVNRMLYIDTKSWLPDDLLVKADKITMANSVELRVPLLDHKVLEFAASLPGNFKIRGLKTKYIAKRALAKLVPKEIMGRKKAGFPLPYASWLRGELKNWVRDVLLSRAAIQRGYFRRDAVEKLLMEDSRKHSYSKEIFSLVTLELWHREFVDQGPGRARACTESTAKPADQEGLGLNVT